MAKQKKEIIGENMEITDLDTGEVKSGKLNEIIYKESRRPDGSLRIQMDFSNCPTMAEQHTAHLTDINYLIQKYKPDELDAYLAARAQYRQEILGHDFSAEPDLTYARNAVYESRKNFDALPEEIKGNFLNHLEFLKFIDNPANAEKMLKLGILKEKQLEKLKLPSENLAQAPTTQPTPGE